MRTVIKVENNLKEILTFLEEKGYKWSSGDEPTVDIEWDSKYIIIDDKILFHKTVGNEPNAITFKQFKKNLSIMKTNNILPGHKLVLENGNVFVVMEYKNTKIAFPEGSSRSATSLEDLCNEDLSPKPGVSRIMNVFNTFNIPIWERKFTRDKIEAGFTMTNKNGANYLIVEENCNLRIVNTKHFVVSSKLCDIVNEDMSPVISYAEIVEVRDREGKVVYKKE